MDEINNLLTNYDDNVRQIALRLREVVLEVMPQANEVVTGHKNISYSTDAGTMKGGMVYIAPFKNSVNLGFIDGIDLPDPEQMLKGTGQRLRHIKFRSLADIDTSAGAVYDLLRAAKAIKSD